VGEQQWVFDAPRLPFRKLWKNHVISTVLVFVSCVTAHSESLLIHYVAKQHTHQPKHHLPFKSLSVQLPDSLYHLLYKVAKQVVLLLLHHYIRCRRHCDILFTTRVSVMPLSTAKLFIRNKRIVFHLSSSMNCAKSVSCGKATHSQTGAFPSNTLNGFFLSRLVKKTVSMERAYQI